MGKKAAKLRRLTAVGVSQEALVEIVKRLRESPELAEAPVTRRRMQLALDRLWLDVGTTLALPVENGNEFVWAIADFPRQLKMYLESSPSLQEAYAQAWAKFPSTSQHPWELVIYDDEIVPGAILRLDNRRKLQGVYVAFRQLGPVYLCAQDVWITVAVLRSYEAKKVLGGWSGCMKALFRRWFEVDKIHEGIVVRIRDTFVRIYVSIGSILADGDAQRAVFSVKGASGKVPCILCKNVLSERTDSDYLVHLSEADPAKFDLSTSAEIWEKCDKLVRLAPPATTKTSHESLQLAYGVSYNVHSLMFDVGLRRFVRPAEMLCYDPMHILLSNGAVEVETSALLTCLKAEGFKWEDLRGFAEADWQICKAYGGARRMQATFAAPREKSFKSDGNFRAGASEMLVAFPIILHFLFVVVRPSNRLHAQLDSYLALGRVLELYRTGKQGVDVSASLRGAIKRHAALHALAYGYDLFKPKHHFLHHVAMSLERHHVIMDCFVGERRHGNIKQAATMVQNTRVFEKSVLVRVIDKQLDMIEQPSFLYDRLANPQPCVDLAALEGVPDAYIASRMTFRGQVVAAGDAVWINKVLHIVQGCCSLGKDLGIFANVYTFVDQVYNESQNSIPVFGHIGHEVGITFGNDSCEVCQHSCLHNLWLQPLLSNYCL